MPHIRPLALCSGLSCLSYLSHAFSFTSALPSPLVSLQNHTTGGSATSTPPFTHITARGITRLSTKMVDLSYVPSPSLSTSSDTRPVGLSSPCHRRQSSS